MSKHTPRDLVFRMATASDPSMKQTDPAFMVAAILLASVVGIGADEAAIAEVLEYEPDFVGSVGSKLRTAGIWAGKEVRPEHFAAWRGENGGVAFFCDVSVGLGDMVIASRDAAGEPSFSMTDSGKARVAAMLGGRA